MCYRGKVKGGVIVIEGDVCLPEGTSVSIEIVSDSQAAAKIENGGKTLGEKLLQHAGTAAGLPDDAARHIDRDLYGNQEQ